MIIKSFTYLIAVIGSAAVTLATMVALVRGTIAILSIDNPYLRIPAEAADVIFGTVLLLGCIYLATRLAVLILGVGQAEFPPLPQDTNQAEPPKN